MNRSKISEYLSVAFFVLIISVGSGHLGGCAKEKEDSREDPPTSSGSAKKREKLKIELEKQMEMHRDRQKAIGIKELIEAYGYQLVPAAEPYLSDSDRGVRLAAKSLILRVGLMSSDKDERQRVVEKILDYGTKNPERKDGIFYDLLPFQAADFSEAAKEILQTELSTSPEYTTILLVGAADIKSSLPALKAMVDEVNEPLKPFDINSKASHSRAFVALMARARMGVKEDVKRCIEVVEAHPDEGFRVGVLLDRISYVRQPEVVEYLKKYLFMDKIEPGPETQMRMTYAQRAMIALSKMLQDFPVGEGKDIKFDTVEEVTAYVRKWMSKQKKWNIIR